MYRLQCELQEKEHPHRDKASWCLEEPTNNHKAAKWIANKEPLPYYRVTQNNIPLNRNNTLFRQSFFWLSELKKYCLR